MLTEQMIGREAEAMRAYAVEMYRLFHQRPELSHREIQTNQTIRKELERFGVPFQAPQDNITIALIHGALPGAAVGIRCDTDALPVKEETGLPFASKVSGVMHACGHDAHIAAGLCAARILKNHERELRGAVKLIFQPAEEGEDGSDEVIATGLVRDIDVFFAIHVWSPFESGTLHVSAIPVSAAVDMFTIHVRGRGGHGATPEKCADALVAGAAVVIALQAVVSRGVSPMEQAVVTIGSFHAGAAGNVIAGEAELKGTFRTLNEETRAQVGALLKRTAECTARAYGCEAEVTDVRVSDAVINDPRAARFARECAEKLVPQNRVMQQRTMMLGDNFANYGVIAPYCYAQVGIADEKKQTCAAHHNGHFCVDEDVLPLCAAWMAAFAAKAGAKWLEQDGETQANE